MDTLEKTFAMTVLDISPNTYPCMSSTNFVLKITFLDNLFRNAEWNICLFLWN